MKKLLAIAFLFAFIFSYSTYAQGFLDKVKQKAKDKVNQRADDKTDKAMDKTLDDAENSTKGSGSTADKSKNSTDAVSTQNAESTSDKTKKPDMVAYGKYDFVPGDKIIFEDHVEGEKLGEFPSKWNLLKGKIEVASLNGQQVIAFLEGNYASITPLMAKRGDYLPDVFSVEFDHFVKSGGYETMQIGFHDETDPSYQYDDADKLNGWISTGEDAEVLQASGEVPEVIRGENYTGAWHHVAMSYNNGNIKIYTDQYRLCNLPNLGGKSNPTAIIFGCIGSDEGTIYIKNVRIAAGGGDLYKRVSTDGKFVTHGILFDVNKSDIKPESMGTLNEIVKLMKDNGDLKFEIGGHTDTDGTAEANLKLSQARAEAVKSQLVKMGIDANRLSTKGYGQSKPIDSNNTPEGKANNRRVEFVKTN